MKAVVIQRYGGPDVLEFTDYPDPIAGANEVGVRIAAAGISPIDTMERAGLTKDFRPVTFPAVLGWDLAGTVAELGSGVTGFSVGDKVFARSYHTYAERCAVNADLLTRLPDGLDLIEAAALPLVTTTGNQLIAIGTEVKAGQTILVSGALGGVGRSAVFTGKDRGGVVIAGVLNRQLRQARDLDANTVRGKIAEQLLGKVKPNGVFASVTGAPANAADHPSIRVASVVSQPDTKTLLYMAQAVRHGKFTIPIARKLPLKGAARAHTAVEQGGSGKILLLA